MLTSNWGQYWKGLFSIIKSLWLCKSAKLTVHSGKTLQFLMYDYVELKLSCYRQRLLVLCGEHVQCRGGALLSIREPKGQWHWMMKHGQTQQQRLRIHCTFEAALPFHDFMFRNLFTLAKLLVTPTVNFTPHVGCEQCSARVLFYW